MADQYYEGIGRRKKVQHELELSRGTGILLSMKKN